jgi:hypothetical protein
MGTHYDKTAREEIEFCSTCNGANQTDTFHKYNFIYKHVTMRKEEIATQRNQNYFGQNHECKSKQNEHKQSN